MPIDPRNLARYSAPSQPTPAPTLAGPPPLPDLVLLGGGNSGEAVVLRAQALAALDGQGITAGGINNDGLGPRAITVARAGEPSLTLALTERLLLAGANPRDRLADYPLLDQRYVRLLRGIPVLETYPRAGHGGHGHPVISALDIDLNVGALLRFCRGLLRQLNSDESQPGEQSDLRRLLAERHRRAAAQRRLLRIAVVGGGCGSMGNAAHHLLPYLLRHLLAELGVVEYELWGFVLGPQAFSGLTPFVAHNYRALLRSLDHMARHGQRRAYIDGLQIVSAAPPYDRLFLLDEPNLPVASAQVSEPELEAFFDQAALTIYHLLACGTVWPTIASHMANPADAVADGRLRFLHTARVAVANLDRSRLHDVLSAQIAADLLEHVANGIAA